MPIVRVIVWIGLGLAVGLWFAATQGATAAAEYYAAYFLEESLSLDNIFVFAIASRPALERLTAFPHTGRSFRPGHPGPARRT
jgi:hypothetical protein